MAPSPKKAKTEHEKVTIRYWECRGRAEAIRLACVLAGIPFENDNLSDETEASEKVKAGDKELPFGQWPTLIEADGKVHCQSTAILRWVGRKGGLYGLKNAEADSVADEVMAGVDDLVSKLSSFIWSDPNAKALDEAAKASFYEKHCDPATKAKRNGGAHLAYIEGYLERNGGEKWVTGKELSVADVCVFENFDKYLRLFPGLKEMYPKLAAHHQAFSQLDKIKEYLASEKRYASLLGHPNNLPN